MPDTKDILKEAHDRYNESVSVDQFEYDEARDDLKFSNGKQWPDDIESERKEDDRPCITINQIPKFVDRVVGDLRENRPGLKFKPVDDVSDPKTADKLEGFARGIESASNAVEAYSTAFEHAVDCGRGFFRIATEYADDESFDQDIMFQRIEDPLSVRWDPSARKYTLEDADYMFVVTRLHKDKFERTYPTRTMSDFDSTVIDHKGDWIIEDQVVLAEYFRKVEDKKVTLYLLEDGTFTDELPKNTKPVRQREVKTYKIERYLLSGAHILEGPDAWSGRYIPIIPVWGKEKWYDGVRHTRGITRFAKDPQRMYNYWRTSETEAVALAPKEPYMVTPAMITGFETMWNNVGRWAKKYLLFNPDIKAPTLSPKRNEPVPYYSGYQTNAQLSAQELMDTTGMPESTIGEPSNEKSGVAIKERQKAGDKMNFTYTDNLVRSIGYAGTVLLDLIPHIYDNERIVRIIGPDNSEDYIAINSEVDLKTGEQLEDDNILDMANIGKYDVTATAGPSNLTRRLEAADWISQLMHDYPESAPALAPMFVQNMDMPKGDDIAELLRAIAPPEIQAIMEQQSGGTTDDGSEQMPPEMAIPPEMAMEEPPVDPTLEIQAAQEQIKLETLTIEKEIKAEELKVKVIETQIKQAEAAQPAGVAGG